VDVNEERSEEAFVRVCGTVRVIKKTSFRASISRRLIVADAVYRVCDCGQCVVIVRSPLGDGLAYYTKSASSVSGSVSVLYTSMIFSLP